MSFTKEILKRATLRGVTGYLLYGSDSNEDQRDYETRLDEAYLKYEKVALQYDKNVHSPLLNSADAMKNEAARVYTELGLQAALLFI